MQRSDHPQRGREVGDGRVSHACRIREPVPVQSSGHPLVPAAPSRVGEIDARQTFLFTKPHYNTGLVVSASFSSELEE